MNSQTVWQRTLSFLGCKPVIIETSSVQLTSDAGLLPMREFDVVKVEGPLSPGSFVMAV